MTERKVIGYKVVKVGSLKEFEEDVKEFLHEGFYLYGSPIMTSVFDSVDDCVIHCYFQALIKYENSDPYDINLCKDYDLK